MLLLSKIYNVVNLSDLKRNFGKSSLDINSMPANPFELLGLWISEADGMGITEPHAMVLSTADETGRPSSRVVLLKEITADDRLVFFTNYESRKGKELAENPYAALNFFWREAERQVRIEGIVSKTSKKVSEQYFSSRPRESNASAIVSPQSRVIRGLQELKKKAEELLSDDEKIALPDFWGGYELKPEMIEFWQGGKDRLHDRILYLTGKDGWEKVRLAP